MEVPAWINRETIQIALIVAITVGFHYYYISSKLSSFASSGPGANLQSALDEDLE